MLLGLGSITTVADTIQKIEGYYPGTPAYRNNNPGNLTCNSSGKPYAIQAGATGCDSSNFAIFPDYSTGYSALEAQIELDASRGETIQEFINKYAPASDGNDPTSYAASIASASGLSVTDLLSDALTDTSSTTDSTDSSSTDTFSEDDSSDSGYSTSVLVAGGVGLAALLYVAMR